MGTWIYFDANVPWSGSRAEIGRCADSVRGSSARLHRTEPVSCRRDYAVTNVNTEAAGNAEEIDFFISYTAVDEEWAECIGWWLEDAGYRVIVQKWDFRPGHNFVLMMQRAASAKHTIAILTPAYLEAYFTQPEWAAAVAKDPTGMQRKLIPIRVEACRPDGLLGQLVYIDLVGTPEGEMKETVLLGVKAGRAKPAAPPPFPANASSELREKRNG